LTFDLSTNRYWQEERNGELHIDFSRRLDIRPQFNTNASWTFQVGIPDLASGFRTAAFPIEMEWLYSHRCNFHRNSRAWRIL